MNDDANAAPIGSTGFEVTVRSGLRTITIHIVGLEQLMAKTDKLQISMDTLLKEVKTHMAAIDDAINQLTAQVEANTTVEGSAVTAFQALAAQIAAAAGNPAAVTALATKLKASADALSAAIVANTPAAPPATP